MTIPIILVHKGDSFYLAHTIAQAQQSNPDSEIILIGDRSNAYYKGVSHYDRAHYSSRVQELIDLYPIPEEPTPFHLTTRFCMERWLILKEFIIKENIHECFHIDSDVLIYQPITPLYKQYKTHSFTVISTRDIDIEIPLAQGGSAFIYNQEILKKLESVIFDLMSEKKGKAFLKKKLKDSELITDMDSLGLLWKQNPDKVLNIYTRRGENIIQNYMMEEDIFEMEGPFAKIYWDGNIPYAFTIDKPREKVSFAIMHFHGKGKWIMRKHLKLNSLKVKMTWLYNKVAYCLLKYPKRYANKLLRKEIFPAA